MSIISEKAARHYPEKFGINMSKFLNTGYHLESGLSDHGIEFRYMLSATHIALDSTPSEDLDGEPEYVMEASLDEGILKLALITWTEENGYFPPFYAHGFVKVMIDHFNKKINGIYADFIRADSMSQMYYQFFEKIAYYKDPTIAVLNTTAGKWFSKLGYTHVEESKYNIYELGKSSELDFMFTKTGKKFGI